MDPPSGGKRTHPVVIIVEFLFSVIGPAPFFSPCLPKNIPSFFRRLPEGENDGTEAQVKKATLPDLREMVRSAPTAWRAAEDMRSHGMPAAMARQEACRMEPEEPFLFQRDLHQSSTGVLWRLFLSDFIPQPEPAQRPGGNRPLPEIP